jgi:diadenosine tetraphosphate (Ap4A) HIT family hydrolase
VRSGYWQVSLAPDQFYLGRAYVTSLEHVPTLSELSDEMWLDLRQVIRGHEISCAESFGATHVTWSALMNNAYRAGEPKPHVYWHARPRYRQPVWVEGRWYNDPDFGSHHQRTLRIEPKQGEMEYIRYLLKQHYP